MSFSGGVYTLPGPALVTGEVVSATENNQFRNDVAGAFNITMLRNGTSTATANLPMGGYKLTGLGVATTSGDALSYGQAATVSSFSASSITDSGNLTFTGTGNRIIGDMSNATLANRVAFQTSTTNAATALTVIPNGTGSVAQINLESDVNQANGVSFQILANTGGTECRLQSGIRGAGTYLPMTFYTGGSERMRIDTSGNVGIGTSSPSQKLDVAGGINAFNGYFFGSSANYLYQSSTQGVTFRIGTSPTYLNLLNSSGMPIVDGAGGNLAFGTSGTERMRIDSNGNVGIGNTNPGFPFDVTSSPNSVAIRLRGRASDNISAIAFDNNTGTSVGQSNYIQSTPNNNLSFGTNNTERMRIDSSGNLLVGTTTPNANSTNSIVGTTTGAALALSVRHNASDAGVRGISAICPNYSGNDGYLYIGNAGGADKFYVRTSGNVQNANNSYGAISDATLKENIVDATPKLTDLLKVRIRNYNLIEDESKTKQIGVVAQELEKVFPGLVETYTPPEGDKQIKSVKYSVFVPMLIKAIQELKAELDATKAEVAALKGN